MKGNANQSSQHGCAKRDISFFELNVYYKNASPLNEVLVF